MDPKELANIRARTDQKLAYARVHLDELLKRGRSNGDVFDRAHHESFLYHLFGAKDSFLQELNTYYSFGLPQNGVTSNNLKQKADSKGIDCKELTALTELEGDANSWMSHAKDMRHHSTHVGGVPRTFFAGGEEDGQVWLKNPKTGVEIEIDSLKAIELWFVNMQDLLEELRQSAIAKNQL